MAAILTFKYTEGAGVEDYSSMGGGGGRIPASTQTATVPIK